MFSNKNVNNFFHMTKKKYEKKYENKYEKKYEKNRIIFFWKKNNFLEYFFHRTGPN